MAQTLPVPTAADIMTAAVVTLDRGVGLLEAAERLLKHKVSNAPVVAWEGTRPKLLGFVSEKDLIQCYASGAFHRDGTLTVGEIMRLHPVGVKAEADLFTLAALFMQHEYRHLPVLKAGELVGIVSRRDVLRDLLAHYHAWETQDPAERHAPDLEGLFAHRFVVG